jgi:hypothetical protein
VWLEQNHPEKIGSFYPMVTPEGMQNTQGGGATGAIQVWDNPVPREVYHTDWVADRTIAWLDSLPAEADWFVWLSFPDPHHPWDPPASERARVDWRNVPLPELYPGDAPTAARWLAGKPRHWQGYFDGSLWTNLESPRGFRPCDMTADQVREIDAMNHIENELNRRCADACCASSATAGQRTLACCSPQIRRTAGRLRAAVQGYHCDADAIAGHLAAGVGSTPQPP